VGSRREGKFEKGREKKGQQVCFVKPKKLSFVCSSKRRNKNPFKRVWSVIDQKILRVSFASGISGMPPMATSKQGKLLCESLAHNKQVKPESRTKCFF
jgi:hypothetical protein